MSPVYSWPFIYTAPALCVASVLLLMQLLYLRKRFVFFDVRYFGVFEIYKHCNSVVICTSYFGTKWFVAESCNIKNLKNGLEKIIFFFLWNFLFGGLPSFPYVHSCHSSGFWNTCSGQFFMPIFAFHCLSILSASEILFEASELFPDCSLMCFICFPNAHQITICLHYT